MKDDLIYFAGFFDGEGCVSISMKGVRVILTNTNELVIDLFQAYFGGIKSEKRRVKKDHANKKCWQIVLWDHHAIKVLSELLPYLKIKKAEAALAFAFMETRNRPEYLDEKGRFKKGYKHGHRIFTDPIIVEMRKQIVKEAREAKICVA